MYENSESDASKSDLPVMYLPTSMAQLDVRPTGDQEVVGSTPTFFHRD